MNTMHMPGFTGEASLRNVSTSHRGAIRASVLTGLVQPAGPFSDSIDLDTSFPSLGPVFVPRPLPCLKWQCIHAPNRNPICFRTLGFWNSITKRCE
jgi:hypothetical protein